MTLRGSKTVDIYRSAQTPCTRICQIFATIYDSIRYDGEKLIKEYLFSIPLTSMRGEFFIQNSILQPRTGLLHLVVVIAIGKESAFSFFNVPIRNDAHNRFGAFSFCIRDSFLQTLHYASINIHSKISFKIFGIGLFGECKKYF